MRKLEDLKDLTPKELLDVIRQQEEMLLSAAQNLGHPAYGHSSGTTAYIDDLRNDIFDYLQIEQK